MIVDLVVDCEDVTKGSGGLKKKLPRRNVFFLFQKMNQFLEPWLLQGSLKVLMVLDYKLVSNVAKSREK